MTLRMRIPILILQSKQIFRISDCSNFIRAILYSVYRCNFVKIIKIGPAYKRTSNFTDRGTPQKMTSPTVTPANQKKKQNKPSFWWAEIHSGVG